MSRRKQREKEIPKQLEYDWNTAHTAVTASSKWDTGDDHKECIANDCTYSKQFSAGIIYITQHVYDVIRALCKDVVDEWQILLKGKEDDNGDIRIDGYIIPKQEVSGATVTNLDCINNKLIEEHSIIATVHSHSTMNCFFSATDEEFTNMSLIPNHIVVNNAGDYKAVTRQELPCGLVKFYDAKMKLDIDENEVEIVGRDNITQKTYQYQKYISPYDWSNNKSKWNDHKDLDLPKKKKYLLDKEHVQSFGYGGGYGMY